MSRPRSWTIDLGRVFAIGVVVVIHWISVRVTVTDGVLRGEPALHGRPIWALSWLIQVMPLFFLAGGFANTLIVDRWRASGLGYGEYLGPRARRLVTPVLALVAVLAPVIAVLGVYSERTAATAAHVVASPLWFLAVYLVAVAVAPGAVVLHDRVPLLLPVVLLGCSLAVDALRFGGAGRFAEWNLVFVWLFCHQLGVVHARGLLRTVTDAGVLLLGVVGVGLLVVMVGAGPYFPTTLGVADAPVSNLAPPTSAISILAVVQLALLTLVDRRVGGWEPRRSLRRVITAIVPLLMTIYLWHVPVIAMLTGAATLVPSRLLPGDPQTWWETRPLWILVGGVVLFFVVRVSMRWDVFCARYAARDATVPAVVGTALAAWGVYSIWQVGLFPVGAGAAVLCVALGAAVLTSTRRTGATADKSAAPA
ncbi:acyltransferase family protein [Nocardia sp. NPDC046473]|uniref:acyltransferase family protein n=1 Tax=Nocardia sp. NPDC046473 TaxID=3155733 RepID=UPI003408A99D